MRTENYSMGLFATTLSNYVVDCYVSQFRLWSGHLLLRCAEGHSLAAQLLLLQPASLILYGRGIYRTPLLCLKPSALSTCSLTPPLSLYVHLHPTTAMGVCVPLQPFNPWAFLSSLSMCLLFPQTCDFFPLCIVVHMCNGCFFTLIFEFFHYIFTFFERKPLYVLLFLSSTYFCLQPL